MTSDFERALLTSTSLLSLLLCAWVVHRLLRLPVPLRVRLFPRLMLFLALMDICFHTMKIAMYQREHWMDVCLSQLFFSCQNFALFSSMFLEMLLSFGFVLQSLGWSRCMRALTCLAPLLLLPASFLGWLSEGQDTTPKEALTCYGTDQGDWVFVSVCIFCCVVSMVSLVAVAYRARASTDVVEKRHLCIALAYFMNALLTHSPLTLAIALKQLIGYGVVPMFVWKIGEFCHGLRGTANSLTFFWQSRYSSEDNMSQNIHILQVTEQSLVTALATPATRSSFHVRFEDPSSMVCAD